MRTTQVRKNALWTESLAGICGTCLAAMASLLLMSAANAEDVSLVVPPNLANVEGDEVAFIYSVPSDGFRAQYSYPGPDFSGLPEGYDTIVSMAWRVDESITNQNSTTQNFELRLSTTSASPGSISNTFADNVGLDEAIVYSGPLTLESGGGGPTGGPRPFDYLIEFDQPFTYDPDQGNLLVDFTIRQPSTGTLFVDSQTTDLIQSRGAVDASLDVANRSSNEIIPVRFTFVPEPSTFALAALALVGLIASRRT